MLARLRRPCCCARTAISCTVVALYAAKANALALCSVLPHRRNTQNTRTVTIAVATAKQQARQVESFIVNGIRKQKIVAPRWRAMTGKRLLRLEHGQRVGVATGEKKGRRPRQDDGAAGAGKIGGPSLTGLVEEGSDTSSSSGSDDGGG